MGASASAVAKALPLPTPFPFKVRFLELCHTKAMPDQVELSYVAGTVRPLAEESVNSSTPLLQVCKIVPQRSGQRLHERFREPKPQRFGLLVSDSSRGSQCPFHTCQPVPAKTGRRRRASRARLHGCRQGRAQTGEQTVSTGGSCNALTPWLAHRYECGPRLGLMTRKWRSDDEYK